MAAADDTERLIILESTVAHLEHELEQMHSVLLALQVELKAAGAKMVKLELRMARANEPIEERDPIDERPPHY